MINKFIALIFISSLLISGCGGSSSTDPALPAQQIVDASTRQFTLFMETPIDFDLGNEENNTNQITVSSQPDNGTLNGNLSGTHLQLTYTPNSNFSGTDQLEFQVDYETGKVSGKVEFNVVNQLTDQLDSDPQDISQVITEKAVSRTSASYTIALNSTLDILIPAGDFSENFNFSQPLNGQLTGQLSGIELSLVYTPGLDYSGTDSIDFMVTHKDGGEATGTITLTILPSTEIPSDPLAISQIITEKAVSRTPASYTIALNSTLDILIPAGDFSENFNFSQPLNGQLTGQLSGMELSLIYTPVLDYSGTDSIDFTVTHKDGGEATGTITLTILPSTEIPSDPLAISQQLAGDIASTLSQSHIIYKNALLPLSLNYSGTQSVVFEITQLPANGSLTGQLTGNELQFIFIPETDFAGDNSIEFSVSHADGGVATGQIAIIVLASINGDLDTDGDGLTDLDEIDFYGTSPVLADTDVDGFSDYTEVIEYGFSPDVNNLRFNPLIADIPQIDIRLVSAPDIFMNFSESNGSSNTISTSRSDTSSNTVTSSNSHEESSSFEHSHSFGIEIGVETEAKAGLFDVGVDTTVSAKFSYNATIAFGQETTNSWTEEQSQENSVALEEAEAFEKSTSIDTSGGGIFVNIEVRNTGNISYTLNNLFLNASFIDLARNNPAVPVGNLVFENQVISEFPKFTLAPGEITNNITFTTAELSIATTKSLLKDSKGLSIKPTVFDLLDENGESYIFNQTGIRAQDATVIVDFGGFDVSKNLTKLIATNADPVNPGISVADILQNVLRLDITTDTTDGFIDSIESVDNAEPQGYWVMLHGAQAGNDEIVTTIYTTPTDVSRVQTINSGVQNLLSNYDISQIRVRGGDVLHLVYMLDDDQDGISNRDEFMYRTDNNNADTDGDGLSDYAEVIGWTVAYTEITGSTVTEWVKSNPLRIDSDGDQLSDFVEANTTSEVINLKRNPNNSDTDGDGLRDKVDDLDATGLFLANSYDNQDLILLDATVVTPGSASDVDVTYSVRDVTEGGAGVSGNGIDSYEIYVYRHVSQDGNHPEPISPPIDNVPALIGETLTCGVSCEWSLVNISVDIPGAIDVVFSETGTDITNFSNRQIQIGENYKYIAYLNINGNYTRSAYSAIASSETETIVIHVKPGELTNFKTIADERTLKSDPNRIIEFSEFRDEIFYERFTVNGFVGRGDVYSSTTGALVWSNLCYTSSFAFFLESGCWDVRTKPFPSQPSDAVAINDSPPYTYPEGAGDGAFDLNWLLVFGENVQNVRPELPDAARKICGSYHSRLISLDGVLVSDPGPVTTEYYLGGSSCSGNDTFADPTLYSIDSMTGGATFTKTVPAQAACYNLSILTYEYNRSANKYNDVYQPTSGNDWTNSDRASLCRDADGIWSITHIVLNPGHSAAVISQGITTQGNPNFIKYRTRTMTWWDRPDLGIRTTQNGNVTMEYEIEIQ